MDTFVLVVQCAAVLCALLVGGMALLFVWEVHAPARVQWDGPVLFRQGRQGSLANRLRFAMLSLPSLPEGGLCAVNLRVEAGSHHEEKRRTGQAHLLEHMLFDQTKNNISGRNQIFFALESLGVGYNAFTTFDATVLQAWDVSPSTIADVLRIFRSQISQIDMREENVAIEIGAVLGEVKK